MMKLRSLASLAVFYGFATSITGWMLTYALRLPGDHVPPMVLGIVLLVTQFSGALFAGRSARCCPGWKVGLATGAVTSLINLLVIGSYLAEPAADGAAAVNPALAATGYLVFGGVLGAIAGSARIPSSRRIRTPELDGRDARPADPDARNWLGRFAILATVAAFALLIVGGIVTSAGAGLAVPDWPTSFGVGMFLFPLSKMTGGVFIEHAHRLLGVLIGLSTATLLIWALFSRVSVLAKFAAAVASALVIMQAVLGGIRVTNTSTVLALVHGVTGQIFVASLALLAGMLSTRWRSESAPLSHHAAHGQRMINLAALAALVIQIGLGAAVRHFDLQPHALMTHLVWSVVALILLLGAGVRAQKRLGPDFPTLRRLGAAVKHSVLLQMVLGVVALIAAMVYHDAEAPSAVSVALRTPHQAVGAVLLLMTTLLTAWTLRLTRSRPGEA